MGLFTARNRQNPFAERRRREAEAAAEAAAVPAPEASPTPPAPKPQQLHAAPVDLNPDSEEYMQAPDISTYATGGFVGQAVFGPASAPEELPADIDEDSPTPPLPDAEDVEREAPAAIEISAETQAKIDAVMNHAIPPIEDVVMDQRTAELIEKANEKRGRGRPRPQETIDRDNAVHELLKAADETGVSKEALALSLDEKEQQVYSSLRQLSKEERAETRYVKGHGYRWFAV